MHYQELAKLLAYCPKDGALIWIDNPTPYHNYKGKEAGFKNGKYQVVYKGKRHQAAILAWFIVTGELPSKRVEHIDNNPFNIQWSNLRLSEPRLYNRKQRLKRNNRSGVKGVSWDKGRNKWTAYIRIDYKQISLGRFDDFNDAVEARKGAEARYWKEK